MTTEEVIQMRIRNIQREEGKFVDWRNERG